MAYPGTKYAIQRPLPIVDALPPPPVAEIVIKPMYLYSNTQDIWTKDIYWTSDKIPLECTTSHASHCNFHSPSHGSFLYNCAFTQLVYSIPIEKPADATPILQSDAFNFNFVLPEYTVVPYNFTHHVIFFGQEMNLFNMYISFYLASKLDTALFQ